MPSKSKAKGIFPHHAAKQNKSKTGVKKSCWQQEQEDNVTWHAMHVEPPPLRRRCYAAVPGRQSGLNGQKEWRELDSKARDWGMVEQRQQLQR